MLVTELLYIFAFCFGPARMVPSSALRHIRTGRNHPNPGRKGSPYANRPDPENPDSIPRANAREIRDFIHARIEKLAPLYRHAPQKNSGISTEIASAQKCRHSLDGRAGKPYFPVCPIFPWEYPRRQGWNH